MPEFFSLSCPKCGAKLQITDKIDKFACNHCGNELIVNRNEGITFLKPVIDNIRKVQEGVDKTASELAIRRLEKEIADLKHEDSFSKTLYYLYKSTQLGSIPRCRSVIQDYFLIDHEIRTDGMFFFEKNSFNIKNAGSVISLNYEELIKMFDYFQQDLIKVNNKHKLYIGNPNKIEIERFIHVRKLLEPIREIKNKVIRKERELQKHREIVSS